MTRSKAQVFLVAAVCGFLMLQGVMADAQTVRFAWDVAVAEIHSSLISWQPAVAYDSAVLTVSGPDGFDRRFEFAAGDALQLRLSDKSLGTLADGQYAWELRLSPVVPSEVRKALFAAHEADDAAAIEQLKRDGKLPEEIPAASGFFRVRGGSVLDMNLSEVSVREPSDRVFTGGEPQATSSPGSGASTKQLITGDLSVNNSACIGFDCAAVESFGSDTMRLKENNLRLHFDDTSTGSFPANDWRLVANDSTSGGASYFTIEDSTAGRNVFVVEAGARSNSLYVEADGDVGIGTANPVTELHLVRGDSPTVRLEQDGSSGFTPQTWDVAGNETSFFVRDVTNGSVLPFRIVPGAPTNSLYIQNNGRIGINAGTNPEAPVDIQATATTIGTGNAAVKMANAAGGVAFQLNADNDATFWNVSSIGGDSQFRISRSGTGNTEMFLTSSGDLNVFGDLSIGGTCAGCDAVFSKDYDLESIEEHAALMWENGHLPAVGPTVEGDTRISVFGKTTGMLNELEKAHIYIEQLHSTILDLQNRLEKLENGAVD